MAPSSGSAVVSDKKGKHAKIQGGKGTKNNVREEREGPRIDIMIETSPTRTGGYGGPSALDQLDLAVIECTEREVITLGRKTFLEKLEELQQSVPNQWVAFEGTDFLGAADSEPDLFGKYNQNGERTGSMFTDFVFAP
jgi:hypothetical protein